MSGKHNVVCVGEVLWDLLPAGLFLGGAPFNVAVHLNRLGIHAEIVSRIGSDRLGGKILKRLPLGGLNSEYIQRDGIYPTGLVQVNIVKNKDAAYTIAEPAAWDFIELNKNILELAETAEAIVFGSLAQRAERSRQTIRALLQKSRLNVFDVNLRPPFDNKEIIEDSLKIADFVKLNEQEFSRLANWFKLPQENMSRGLDALSDKFHCSGICVTRGAHGALLFRNGVITEHPGYKVPLVDTVGSGDGFLAGLLYGLLKGEETGALLNFANALGAYIAGQNGATPPLNFDVINEFMKKQNAPD